ncbi:hypothetical protein AOLI_G00291280 [Acnodon oligacanthus]
MEDRRPYKAEGKVTPEAVARLKRRLDNLRQHHNKCKARLDYVNKNCPEKLTTRMETRGHSKNVINSNQAPSSKTFIQECSDSERDTEILSSDSPASEGTAVPDLKRTESVFRQYLQTETSQSLGVSTGMQSNSENLSRLQCPKVLQSQKEETVPLKRSRPWKTNSWIGYRLAEFRFAKCILRDEAISFITSIKGVEDIRREIVTLPLQITDDLSDCATKKT